MLNFEQEVELGKKLKIWSIEPSQLKAIDLIKDGLPCAYIYEPIKAENKLLLEMIGKF